MSKSAKTLRDCVLTLVLFFVVGNPMLFKLVNQVVNKLGAHDAISDKDGCPTQVGSVVHAVVFVCLFIILKMVTGPGKRLSVDMVGFLVSVVLFWAISNRVTYKYVNKFFNHVLRLKLDVSSPSGCPTQGGVVVHAVVFVLVTCLFFKGIGAF